MLESKLHSDNSFATLTYSDETLPKTTGPTGSPTFATLNPKDLQDFLKRLRKSISPLKIRYFAVGEYGDETQRPHYHLALFGYPNCYYGKSQFTGSRQSCCSACNQILSTWSRGQIYLGTLETESAQYISGYVTKKMTARDDSRLLGRHPEFCRMSLRPGIGADFMHEVASELLHFNLEKTQADVPSALRHGSRQLPLGRYLRKRLRTLVGKEANAPEIVLQQIQEELRPLREAAFNASQSFKKTLVASSDTKVLQIETRSKIRRKARPI